MASPIIINCPQGVWTKVASGIMSGVFQDYQRDLKISDAYFFHTFRIAGAAAPTDDDDAMLLTSLTLSAQFGEPSDVYIKAVNIAGRIRVEL